MPKLVAEMKYYKELNPAVGSIVYFSDGEEMRADVLSVWTAQNGNEAWQVGDFDNGGGTIFSPEIVEKVVPIFNTIHIVFKN